MKKLGVISTLVLMIALASPTMKAADIPFNILEQNKAVVTDIRAEGENVWIKLASAHSSDTIIVRISNKNKDFYRPWFHGNVDLESSGFRGNGVWSDRVQTQAQYIEYWLNDQLVLQLERK